MYIYIIYLFIFYHIRLPPEDQGCESFNLISPWGGAISSLPAAHPSYLTGIEW